MSSSSSVSTPPVSSLYRRRKLYNNIATGLATAGTIFGLIWLAVILIELLFKGISGLGIQVFTENTPPPGAAGGLLNAIMGSIMMTAVGVIIGAPIGILAGTFMAEYGRGTKMATTLRFLNDILLSAPSIVTGLFVYEFLVRPFGHFSGWAGSVALSIIVIPVVVRTSEDMLLLVPNTLREAGAALGAPRVTIITNVIYRAARAGILTGLLLAVARISGETAPLLFTALNNQFFSLDMGQPIASLPVVIFQFAMSPYKDWNDLAWTGALLITVTVLAINIIARTLSDRGEQR